MYDAKFNHAVAIMGENDTVMKGERLRSTLPQVKLIIVTLRPIIVEHLSIWDICAQVRHFVHNIYNEKGICL